MDILRKIPEFFGLLKEPDLTSFQCKKLLHEFNTFYDINHDGRLQWKDMELARDYVCSKSGWQPDSAQWMHCRQLFTEMWRNLLDTADSDMDGEVTTDEWLQMWTKINREKRKFKNKTPSKAAKKSGPGEVLSKKDDREAVPSLEDEPSSSSDVHPRQLDEDNTRYLPRWFDNYVEYKFNLLDRAGDGAIDEEEFEFTLSDGFDVSPHDCRTAFRIFTKNGEKTVDRCYFEELALQFYLSDDPSDLGNFINGKLIYE